MPSWSFLLQGALSSWSSPTVKGAAGGIFTTCCRYWRHSLAPPPGVTPYWSVASLHAPLLSCRHAGEIETTAPLRRGPTLYSSHRAVPSPSANAITTNGNTALGNPDNQPQHLVAAKRSVLPHRARRIPKTYISSTQSDMTTCR